MSNDFYCDSVLSGKIPVKIVAETEKVLAFHHTSPTWETHIVVIPKRHIRRLIDVEDPDLFADIFRVLAEIIKEKGFGESNYKVITNGGSFQSTQHLHFHLVSGKPLDPKNPAQAGEMAA